MTLTFNPLRAIVMIYSCAKVQGQRSVGSKDRVETDRRTEATALPPSLMRSVNIYEKANSNTKHACRLIQSAYRRLANYWYSRTLPGHIHWLVIPQRYRCVLSGRVWNRWDVTCHFPTRRTPCTTQAMMISSHSCQLQS